MTPQVAFAAGVVVGALVIYLVLEVLPNAWPVLRWIIQAVLTAAFLYYLVAQFGGWPLPFVT